MDTIRCEECETEMPATAELCPSCGLHPDRPSVTGDMADSARALRGGFRGLKSLFGIVVVAALLVLWLVNRACSG